MAESTRILGYGATTRERQIWQHVRSGERYVVEIGGGGHIFAAAGPLHYRELDTAMAQGFEHDPDVAADLQHTADDYRLYVDQAEAN